MKPEEVEFLRRWDTRYDILGAFSAGAIIPLERLLVPWESLSVPLWLELTIVVVSYLLVLILVCLPLTQYRRGIRLSLFGAAGAATVGTLTGILRGGAALGIFPWMFPVGIMLVLLVVWTIGGPAILGLTYLRLRWLPVFPDGYCQRCGYCLFGLPTNRCPECGITFETGRASANDKIGVSYAAQLQRDAKKEHVDVAGL